VESANYGRNEKVGIDLPIFILFFNLTNQDGKTERADQVSGAAGGQQQAATER
jgi:hypothetical protein